MNLEQWVVRLRQEIAAELTYDQSEAYRQIHQACQPCVRIVSTRFWFLGTFVVDVADEKLHDCLLTCPTEEKFLGYFRRALLNAANDEIRRRKRLDAHRDDDDFTGVQTIPRDELDSRLDAYAHRKRNLIDQLTFSTALRMSTLLLDQRQIMAQKVAALVDAQAFGVPSVFVEGLELWHLADQARFYNGRREPLLQEVWRFFSTALDSQPDQNRTQKAMVAAINEAGGAVQEQTWRQQVQRYRQDVREQVSESEWKLFHA